jgi:hypothetical protein
MGSWRGIGEEFTVDAYDPPRPPRYATKVQFEVRAVNACCQVIRVVHDASDTWGVGRREVGFAPSPEFPDGFLRIRYSIVGERIQDPSLPPQPVVGP